MFNRSVKTVASYKPRLYLAQLSILAVHVCSNPYPQ